MYNHNHRPITKFDFLPAIQISDERQQLASVFINIIADSLYLTNNNDSIVQFLS